MEMSIPERENEANTMTRSSISASVSVISGEGKVTRYVAIRYRYTPLNIDVPRDHSPNLRTSVDLRTLRPNNRSICSNVSLKKSVASLLLFTTNMTDSDKVRNFLCDSY
jgi:hypothetical protein